MGTRDKRVDDYIAKAPAFAQPMLERIREDFHKASPKIDEDIKWGVPAFVHQGLVGGMAAFKKHVGFGFWRVRDLPDPDGLFPGNKAGSPFRYKATRSSELPPRRTLQAYVKRAVALNAERAAGGRAAGGRAAGGRAAGEGAAGGATRPRKKKATRRAAPRVPADLAARLAENPRAKKTYDGFPPSAKRDYVEWITGAKREATRKKRLATTIEWLSEGKRRNWKYERC